MALADGAMPEACLGNNAHILENKVMQGAAVPWSSGDIGKASDFTHADSRMTEELKLDKGTDSFRSEM